MHKFYLIFWKNIFRGSDISGLLWLSNLIQSTGNSLWYGFLQSINFLWNTVSFIHVQDICDAHVFLMEYPAVGGRYFCSGHSTTLPKFAHLIFGCYPQYIITSKSESFQIYLVQILFDLYIYSVPSIL